MSVSVLLFTIMLFFGFICQAQGWDIDVLQRINLHRNRSLDDAFRLVTDYAAPIAYTMPVLLFLLAITKKKLPIKRKIHIYH